MSLTVGAIEIRKANPSEADTLTEIAFAAKRYWNYPGMLKVGERDSKPNGRVLDVMALELPPNFESIS